MILKYPVRAALNPFASTIGYLLPFVVSGSIVVSLVLSLPTVGPLLLRALVAQDMFLAGAIVLLLGVLTVIGTFISDLVLMWIDPRIRAGHAADEHGHRTAAAAPADGATAAEEKIAVATQLQLTWWRFRKHRVAVASAVDRRSCSTSWRCSPISSPTADPHATEAERSYIPPQSDPLVRRGRQLPAPRLWRSRASATSRPSS